jgi:hypothetical protein
MRSLDREVDAMKALKVLKVLVCVVAVVTVLSLVVMSLWNWLMPAIFGWRAITWAQALGLLVLSKILFGGFHKHVGGGRAWKRHMAERWAQMSPEERERFRAGMKARWGACGFVRPDERGVEQPGR